jgi:hypothetical protein
LFCSIGLFTIRARVESKFSAEFILNRFGSFGFFLLLKPSFPIFRVFYLYFSSATFCAAVVCFSFPPQFSSPYSFGEIIQTIDDQRRYRGPEASLSLIYICTRYRTSYDEPRSDDIQVFTKTLVYILLNVHVSIIGAFLCTSLLSEI